MNKKGFAPLGILIVILLIAGAGGYLVLRKSSIEKIPEVVPIGDVDDSVVPIPTPNPSVQSQAPKNISLAHTTFGFNSLKILVEDANENNIFISPSSIALALSMVYNGAAGETKTAIQNTLQFQNLDLATVNQESLGLINSLKNPDPDVELSVANSLWARKGMDFKKDFLTIVANYFNAEISTLNFEAPTAADTINAWVSKNTKGKIQTIVTPPIPSTMVMYLINAIYFKGTWTSEFSTSMTQERDFTLSSGVAKKHPLMQQRGDFSYLETVDFQSISMPYGKSKRIVMDVFLPKNLDSFVQNLTATTWNSWINKYQTTEGTILLPKFKMEYEKSLIPLLTQLGMGVAFSGADFSGIGEGLVISEVKHKTYIDVNEEGTEAAAVTSIGVGLTSAGVNTEKTFYMEVNRPFFVSIRDTQTQEIIFMGVIKNP